MKSFAKIFLILIISAIVIGCSNGGRNNPVESFIHDTDNTTTDLPTIAESDILNSERDFESYQNYLSSVGDSLSYPEVLGSFDLVLNENTLTAEFLPSRKSSLGESFIVSGLSLFTINPCIDCLRIESIGLTEDGFIQIDFNISHPFKKGNPLEPPSAINRLDLDLFDMALVIAPLNTSTESFEITQIDIQSDFCPFADGYTLELSNLINDNTAYPYFLVVDNSETSLFDYNKFEMGTKDAQFQVYFRTGGTFKIFLTTAFGVSATLLDRLNPKYFNPEFNRKAAWKVEVIPPEGDDPPARGNTWDSYDTNTPYDVTVKVFDWQQDATISQNYPDENNLDHIYKASNVSSVSAEIQGMTEDLNVVTSFESGDGSPSDPLIYKIPIKNENKLPQGEYLGLVKVTDERIPASPAYYGRTDTLTHTADGSTFEWYEMDEFATYQVFTATVVIGDNITVKNPNGGEAWIYSEPAIIEWISEGSTTQVNIDLSTDCGENFTIPIAENYENTGLFDFGQSGVGDWITEDARVRVSSVDNPLISDISDADFSIICPGIQTPENITATDGDYHNKILVSWDSVPDATGYNIYRDDELQESEYSNTSWEDTSVEPGVIYSYQVQTVKGSCTSSRSENEPGHACVIPDQPFNVTASDGEFPDLIQLSWNDAGVSRYNIYRDNEIQVTDYPDTTWIDSNITPGIIYYYQIESINEGCISEKSPAEPGEPGHACKTPTEPSPVVASDGIYSDHINVSWSDVGAEAYNIYKNTDLEQENIQGTSWDDYDVDGGEIYYYQVEARNGNCLSEKTPGPPGESGFICSTPQKPTGFAASDGTFTYFVRLTWNQVIGASSYNVYRDGDLLQSNIITTSWNDQTAVAGILYTYEAAAVNQCGPGQRSNSDTGYIKACPDDNNNSCDEAEKLMIEDLGQGCVSMVDKDWYYFYTSPGGYAITSTISVNVDAPVNIYVYAMEPGQPCPGQLMQSWQNIEGLTTLHMPSANFLSKLYIKIEGATGKAYYAMYVNFRPYISNLPIEVYVATTDGSSHGTWPLNGSTSLTHDTLVQLISWGNEFWDQYGYKLVWDGTEEFMSAKFYNLDSYDEVTDMHLQYNSGGNKVCLYFVNQLPPGYETAFARVFRNQAEHNVYKAFSVYGPNVWDWPHVVPHEHGHIFGYLNDQYLYDIAECPCGNRNCFKNFFGYEPFLYDDQYSCYEGNLMFFYQPGFTIDMYDLTDGQYNWVHEFNFNNPLNFPWY